MTENNNGNGNVTARIDIAKLQESFKYVVAELKKLDIKVEKARNEIRDTKDELKEDIADIRGDIKLLFFKVGFISVGSGSIAAIILKFVG